MLTQVGQFWLGFLSVAGGANLVKVGIEHWIKFFQGERNESHLSLGSFWMVVGLVVALVGLVIWSAADIPAFGPLFN